MKVVDSRSNTPQTQRIRKSINLKYVLFLGITAALAGLMFGFDIAIITGAGPFLKIQFNLADLSLGLAFSSLLFGCALGALVMGCLADRFGRRQPLIWVAALFAVTSLATGLAPDFTMFLVARFLGGLAVGGASILAPMYVAEVAPPSLRGRMCASYQMAIVIGILISFLLNYLLRDFAPWVWFNTALCNLGQWNWRWMFISGLIPSMVFFFLILKAPETPRYLYKCGREREAMTILERISGKEEAALEMKEIRINLQRPNASWSDLKSAGLRRALAVGFVLAVLIHFSGINTIIDYAAIIFKSAQFKMDAALFATFGIGLVNFLFTFVSFWTIDRFGRKPLYMIGSFGMCAILLTLALAAASGHFKGMTVLVLILSYIACFASCIGPVFWTLVPEIFPNRVRSEAMIVPVMVQWIANAVVVLLFPSAITRLGQGATFLLLGVMALAQMLFTWRCVPETKGRTLEQIESMWDGCCAKTNGGLTQSKSAKMVEPQPTTR
jgi:SP family arabinose:H+ symporter-like MFS transporter